MQKLNLLDWVAILLVVIGGVNWGLIGLFEFDLVAEIFGAMSGVARVIYVLVGLSAVYLAAIMPMLSRHRMGSSVERTV